MATYLKDLIETISEDIPTNIFTIEDEDPHVILGKINEVIKNLKNLQSTINSSDAKSQEALQKSIEALNNLGTKLIDNNGNILSTAKLTGHNGINVDISENDPNTFDIRLDQDITTAVDSNTIAIEDIETELETLDRTRAKIDLSNITTATNVRKHLKYNQQWSGSMTNGTVSITTQSLLLNYYASTLNFREVVFVCSLGQSSASKIDWFTFTVPITELTRTSSTNVIKLLMGSNIYQSVYLKTNTVNKTEYVFASGGSGYAYIKRILFK